MLLSSICVKSGIGPSMVMRIPTTFMRRNTTTKNFIMRLLDTIIIYYIIDTRRVDCKYTNKTYYA